jgi:hypothetical protein
LEISCSDLASPSVCRKHMTDKVDRHDGIIGATTEHNRNEEENETRRRNAMRGRNEMSR